ncbi:MAG: hypothetical protein R6W90_18870, partial [Ignavibacteriaceae bacterium]
MSSCAPDIINGEFSRLEKIGTFESPEEILQREMCSYPLYVNDIADTVKMVQKYPNPCSPSFVRTFIFRVEKETVVNIKLGLPSRDSVVTILHK